MRIINIAKLFSVLFIIFLLFVFFFTLWKPPLSNKISENCDIVVIEAWLGSGELENTANLLNNSTYKNLIIVGEKYPDTQNCNPHFPEHASNWKKNFIKKNNAIRLSENGLISFRLKKDSVKKVTLIAKGSFAGFFNSHINVYLNDINIGSTFLKSYDSLYTFSCDSALKNIEIISVHFDNDLFCKTEDRNLRLKSVSIDDHKINEFENFKIYSRKRYHQSCVFYSKPKICLNYLNAINFNTDSVKLVSTYYKGRNKTRQNAEALKQWIIKNKLTIHKTITIISIETHAKRSYISYSKVLKKLDPDIKINVIPINKDCIYSDKVGFPQKIKFTIFEILSLFN